MASHYNVKYGISFNSEEDAHKFINTLDKPERWFPVPCHCDNLNWAERLAFYHPRLFGWLLKREY